MQQNSQFAVRRVLVVRRRRESVPLPSAGPEAPDQRFVERHRCHLRVETLKGTWGSCNARQRKDKESGSMLDNGRVKRAVLSFLRRTGGHTCAAGEVMSRGSMGKQEDRDPLRVCAHLPSTSVFFPLFFQCRFVVGDRVSRFDSRTPHGFVEERQSGTGFGLVLKPQQLS